MAVDSLYVKENAIIDGDLQVKGKLILSENNVTCTTENAGTTRYNQSAGKMEFCHATVWQTMGGVNGVVFL